MKKNLIFNSDLTFTYNGIYIIKYPATIDSKNNITFSNLSQDECEKNNKQFIKLLNVYNIPFILSTNLFEYIIHKNKIIVINGFIPSYQYIEYLKRSININEFKEFILMKDI